MASALSESIDRPPDPRWGSEDRPKKAEAIWQTLLHFHGPNIGQGAWLDIGCGSGGIAATLAPRVRQITGLDPEPWARWSDWMDAHPNLTFLQGSYDSQPVRIEPESMDVVICNQVYEHVADPVALIAFIHRSLKPGGICYFAGPNLLFPIEPHVFWPFVHWLPREFALWLMRKSGSRSVLDAYSTDYWSLHGWFRQYEVINAIPYILRHPDKYHRSRLIWRLFSRIPVTFMCVLTPLSPAFVFILRKQAQ